MLGNRRTRWRLAMTKRYKKSMFLEVTASIRLSSSYGTPIVHHLWALLLLGNLKPNCGETNDQEWLVNNPQPPSSTLPGIETLNVKLYHPYPSTSLILKSPLGIKPYSSHIKLIKCAGLREPRWSNHPSDSIRFLSDSRVIGLGEVDGRIHGPLKRHLWRRYA